MYTNRQLFHFQSILDLYDYKRSDRYNQGYSIVTSKYSDKDIGMTSSLNSYVSGPAVYSGCLTYQYVLRRIDENQNIIVSNKREGMFIQSLLIKNINDIWTRTNVLGWRRNPEKIFDNFDEAVKVTGSDYLDLLKYTKQLKTEEDRDLNIYYEYNKGEVSLDDVLEKFQLNIINGYSGESIHISGPAGTGKSVVASKIYDRLKSKIALVPNDNVKSIYNGSNVYLFSSYSKKIANEIVININDVIKNSKIPRSLLCHKKISLDKNTNIEFNWLSDRANKLLFDNNDFILNIHSMDNDVANFLRNVGHEEINKLYETGQIFNEIDNLILQKKEESNIIDIAKILIKEFYNVSNVEKFIVLDESPILSNYVLIYATMYYAARVNRRFILAYDIAQHSRDDIVKLRDIISVEDTYKLAIVFRTTKEIFNFATQYMESDEYYKTPISVKDSLFITTEPKYENFIKFSEILKNRNEVIGAEYENLSVEIDAPVLKSNAHLFYILCTRAIKSLNIVEKDFK